MSILSRSLATMATLLLLTSLDGRQATAQLASPLSSADGYQDSMNHGYTLSEIVSPSVTSIATTGTLVDTGDDGTVDTPIGFNFDYFGTTYTDLQVNGNAIVYMGTGYDPASFYLPGASDNGAHPEDNGGVMHDNYAGPMIAFGWDDWNVTAAETTGGIYSETRGTAGNREFVLEFNQVARFAGDPRGVDSIQLVLNEGSNEIEMHYIDNDGPYDNGLAIGIQKNDFTYLQYLFLDGDASTGTGKPLAGESLLWTPPAAPVTLEVVIDRSTGRVTIENNTGQAQQIKGYEISSLDGPFDPSNAPFLADSDSSWIQLSANDGGDLSEGHLTTGTIGAGQTIDFGEGAWAPYYKEEAEFKFVNAAGETLRGPLTYTGGTSYEFLDLNFDGSINVQDWVTFRDNVGNDLESLNTVAQLYRNSDLNADGVHNTRDFLIFVDAFDAANGAGAFAAAVQSVPEPSTLVLMGLVGVCGVSCRRRRVARLVQKHARRGRSMSAVVFALAVATLLLSATPTQAQFPILSEDFEGLPYGPNQEEGTEGDEVWTDVPPDGWTIDRTGVPGFDEPPENNGVKEWIGWNFANRDWWVEAAGGQDREQFTNARGGVMVADPDEWDDAAHPPSAENGWYDTTATLPAVSLSGLPENVVNLSFDSSWRPEFDSNFQQSGVITVSFDSGPEVEVLRWLSDPNSPFFHPDNTNEEVSIDINNPQGASEMVVKFRMFDAGNDWWWAVDNLNISAIGDPVTLEVNKTTGAMTFKTGDLPSVFNSYNIVSEAGALDAAGWNAGNLASSSGGGGSPADADGSGLVDGNDFLLLQRAGTDTGQWEADFGSAGGGSPGDQWEVLNGDDEQLFEAYLFGETFLDAESSLSIGNGYDTTSGAEDLTFVYTTPTGFEVEGVVTYVTGAAAAVPEPTSLLLAMGAVAAGLSLRRRREDSKMVTGETTMQFASSRMGSIIAAFACLVLWTSTAAAQTNDRLYNLGDSEPTNGAGTVVGSGAGSFGVTWDDAGQPGNNQFQDLSPVNGPTYASVAGRPNGGSGLGVEFDGSSMQYLFGPRFGAPTSTATSDTVAGGTLDYFDITSRGMAFWVKPGNADGPQSIVMDTNQHGVRISEGGNFAMRYNGLDFETNFEATPGAWYHIELVQPTTGGARMYIDGLGAAAATGGYNTGDDAPLVIGANTLGTLSSFTGGNAEFFTGVVDELSMYVLGTSDAGTNYGTYDFVADNAIAAATFGPSPNLLDINQDGSVSGDGTGPAASDDVTAFVQGWQTRTLVNGVLVADVNTIANGDVNQDGIVNIRDWAELNAANPSVGAAILANLGAVPEPTSLMLAAAGLAGCLCRRRR